jgi:hypothetical protein
VAAMEACLSKGSAGEVAAWAALSFAQKCKWGLTAADGGGFQPSVASAMHECMAVGVAKFMAGALDVFADVPSLRSLALPYACPPTPTVLQGMPVLMTRPPRRGYPDPAAVRLLVWPKEACVSIPWCRGDAVGMR